MRTYSKAGVGDYKQIHFIGVGGVNMNCLARLLNNRGFRVTGSDRKQSEVTDTLVTEGIRVFFGHSADNIKPGTDLVVYTAAVRQDNVELETARERGIKTMERAEFLGMIMRNYQRPVCVAGTHGKTTTTSMLAEMMIEAGADPTALVGGFLNSIGGNLRDGGDDLFVAESCEYYDSFLRFAPFISVVLNIEADHLDYFKNLEAIRESFAKFCALTAPGGAIIINSAIADIGSITDGIVGVDLITFGLFGADFVASNITYDTKGMPSFDVLYKGELLISAKLSVPGEHNVLNALAAIAVCKHLGIDIEKAITGLSRFAGAKRRFQFKGEFSGVIVVDDYAHHPTEIRNTLVSAKNISHGKLWAIFQPHTHSRTKNLLNEFADSFIMADAVIINDIYSPAGREEPSVLVHAKDLVKLIAESGKEAYYFAGFKETKAFLRASTNVGDMIITMGAGDITELSDMLIN